MKKVLFVVTFFAATFLTVNKSTAQTTSKIGVFDIDAAVQGMPGYRSVDSMLQIYQQDSLRGEYEFAVKEYNRLDSTYKKDSAAGAAGSVLSYQKDQRSQIATTIVYWQQISQQKSEAKRQELASSLYERVLGAYSRVLKSNAYLVVLKPGAYELGSVVDNVFEKVFREMKLPVPDQFRSQGPQQQGDQQAPPTGAPAPRAGGAKGTPKKP